MRETREVRESYNLIGSLIRVPGTGFAAEFDEEIPEKTFISLLITMSGIALSPCCTSLNQVFKFSEAVRHTFIAQKQSSLPSLVDRLAFCGHFESQLETLIDS